MGRSGRCPREELLGMALAAAAALWICCALPVSRAFPLPQPLIAQSGTFGLTNRFAMWQLPEGPVERVLIIYSPIGVLPTFYWDYSPSCPSCMGYPERRQIVVDALARNYAVFVPQQGDPDAMWVYWPEDNPDLLVSLEMIAEWKTMMGLHGLPTVGLGPASGGFILSTVSLRKEFFDAIALMISSGTDHAINASTSAFPPTVFVHMPNATGLAEHVKNARAILDSNGVLTKELKWYPTPITPEWFSDSIPRLDVPSSNAIFSAIKREGWTDGDNYIITDSWNAAWPADLRRWDILPKDRIGEVLEWAVKDEIMVAWAKHTTIARLDKEMFEFFEKHAPITHQKTLISSF